MYYNVLLTVNTLRMIMETESTTDFICTTRFEEALDFNFYKILLDPVRTKLIVFLGTYGDSNIKQISEHFPQDRTVISRHLSLMARYGILSRTKKSREYIYHLNADFIVEKFENTATNLKKLTKN